MWNGRGIFTSLINKIISQLRARQALIYRVISLHSLFFILFSKQTKQQRSPEWKCREESQIKTTHLNSAQSEASKDLEGSADYKGIPPDLGIQRRKFSPAGAWHAVCSAGWEPASSPVKLFLSLCRAGFSPGLQQEPSLSWWVFLLEVNIEEL